MMPRILSSRGARVALVFAFLACAPVGARAESSPAAVALADRVVATLGGREAWDRTGYVTFDFVASRHDTVLSRRSLAWDRTTDRIRLEMKDPKGHVWAVWTDLAHADGVVRVDGAPADSVAKEQWLRRAYAIWVNDTYWLLMPFKLHDPGVTLADGGVDSTGKGHVLELSFAQVGLTPGDRYRVHVDDTSGLITGWEMLLQGNKDGRWKPATWTGWRSFGDIQLADERHIPEDQIVLRYEKLATARSAPPGAFDPPTGQ